MPRTRGTPGLPLSAFAATVETDRPLREAPAREPDAVDRVIAELVARPGRGRRHRQMGVGSLPSAVLESLAGHADLGFHTGMITDGVIGLIERGVVTGASKEIDQGLVITGAALGSRHMYNRLPEFPVEFRPASYTHAPAVLSQLSRWCRSTRRSRSTCSARSAPSCGAACTSAPSAVRSTSAGRPR